MIKRKGIGLVILCLVLIFSCKNESQSNNKELSSADTLAVVEKNSFLRKNEEGKVCDSVILKKICGRNFKMFSNLQEIDRFRNFKGFTYDLNEECEKTTYLSLTDSDTNVLGTVVLNLTGDCESDFSVKTEFENDSVLVQTTEIGSNMIEVDTYTYWTDYEIKIVTYEINKKGYFDTVSFSEEIRNDTMKLDKKPHNTL